MRNGDIRLGLRPGRYAAEVTASDGKSAVLPPLEIEADLEQDLAAPAW